MIDIKDEIDVTYNYLTVKSFSHKTKGNMKVVNCVCKCGNKRKVVISALRNGRIKSCGCIRNLNYKMKPKSRPSVCSKERLEQLFKKHNVSNERKEVIHRIRNIQNDRWSND